MERPGRAAAGAAAAGAVVAAVAWRALWQEPRSDRIRELDLALPGWPPALDGLRVALVSDLHAGAPHVREARIERLVAAVGARRPDLVLLLGDYVDPTVALGTRSPRAPSPRGSGRCARRSASSPCSATTTGPTTAPGCAPPCGRPGSPCSRTTPCPPATACGWPASRRRASAAPTSGARCATSPTDAPVILLSHDPDVFPAVPARVALTVSGHLHGGQVGVPVVRRPFLPSRFGERYARGHVTEGGRHLFVTTGIGTTGLPVRLLAPPEAIVLALSPA